MRSLMLSLSFAAGIAGLLGVSPPTVPETPDRPIALHPAARAVIDTKMEAHALEMTDLLMLIVLREHEDAADAAERIASEPRIGRALERSDASAGLPEAFFRLQDRLSKQAEAVADAARAHDDTATVRAFGELAATCVACHTMFLEPSGG